MRKKTIAILLLLAVMFCAFAETKTLNVNLSIVPIFEVKWTGTQLTEDNAKTTSLDSLSAPDPIVLNSDKKIIHSIRQSTPHIEPIMPILWKSRYLLHRSLTIMMRVERRRCILR